MTNAKNLTPLEAVNEIRNNNNGQVVLVLQGGGALGAYQGGVYQALHEAGVEPDWIIGTSIGAINAALISGNASEDRLTKLREFWHRVERANFWGAFPAWAGVADALSSWMTITSGISGFFEPHTRAFLGAHVPLGADQGRILFNRAIAQDAQGARGFRSHQSRPPAPHCGRRTCPLKHDALLRFEGDEAVPEPRNGLGRAASGLSRGPHRRRALLGRRHSLQHADRADFR